MKIGLAQIALKDNIEMNFRKSLDYMKTAAEKGADAIDEYKTHCSWCEGQ